MVVEARIAAAGQLLSERDLSRLISLLQRVDLPYSGERLPSRVDGEAIVAAMEKVRQMRAGSLRYVLPIKFGETLIADDVEVRELRDALRASGIHDRTNA
jgi:3-dehydroquinate synthase